jgi:hypothetical protein
LTAQTPIRARTWWVVLAAGAAPAALAASLAPELYRAGDLPVAAAAAVLLLLACALPLRAPRLSERALLAGALLLGAAPAVLGAVRLHSAVTNDERAYLLQAELFAEGRLVEPLPQPPEVFRRRQVYEDAERGVRYAKYPPGTSLALTPGVALGWPALATALAGLASVLLAAAVARRLGLARPALVALLLGLSPFFLLTQTSYQSEIFTLPAALAGYLALLRVRDASAPRGAAAWAGLLGASAGWIFLCRPLTGVVFAAACGIGILGARHRLAALVGAVAAGLPFAALFLVFNALWTGDPLQTPYELYARVFGPFASDGAPVDLYGNGDFLPMLLDQAGRWSVAFAGILGAVALGYWGLLRLRAQDGGAALLFASCAPLAYAFHWYPGHWAYLGPLYCYESLGFLLCGALAVAQSAPPRLGRAFVLAALLAGPAAFAARWPQMVKESDFRSLPERLAREQTPSGAVIFLPPPSRGFDAGKYWTPTRPPWDPDARLLLRLPPRGNPLELGAALGLTGRPTFVLVPDEQAGGRLQQLSPPP